ncbi:hypothetical protein GE061_016111 [Apolygus lucorum]|uniref:Insulin-degrading enzyme n=1 Tax=Apolygus lucorum TaxID=248454 RepID=A0A6A4K3T2_APOLU|nr:hypothetical protein GE061_016111 [Apolygus lucorum]
MSNSPPLLRQLEVRKPECIGSPYGEPRFYAKMNENLLSIGRDMKIHDNIIKSAEDKRFYRGLELKNGMKVVLVSDPTTDKSAAAMCVNVGYMSDPPELPGLAHFCEHMLFLGTEKYPNENDYTKFLSEHGGGSNASTTTERTTYYFDVTPEYFPGALDRFAQFFIKPLFNEDSTDREVKAVDSEHEKNLQSDAWRFDQLEKSFAKLGHPFRKFGTGNRMTLDILPKQNGVNVRDELLKFHSKRYSANVMTLAVIGKESLNELQTLVENLFSDVVNKNVEVPVYTDHPYQKNEVTVKDYVVPIKDLRQLAINFPIPNYHDYYTAGPVNYLSHLIGHEGSGSLLSELRAKGWCNNLSGGTRGDVKGFDVFCISVDLTEEGIDHIDDIVYLVFQYINMLRKEGPQRWVFDEHAELLNMHFRFKDKSSPTSTVNSISHKLLDYPFEDVLFGSYKLTDWRPDLITELLGYLRPDNVRVSVVGKKFKALADKKEEWYGTEYKLEKIEPSVIERWSDGSLNSKLHLPDKNEFIPSDFDLAPRDEPHKFPIIIQENDFCRAWYKQDDEYFLPKANIRFEFLSPLAYQDPLNCNLTYMFVILFKDALLEYAYAAQLAGLRWELTNTKYGMVLGIGGYNHKQKVFLEKIMDKMVKFEVDPKRFDILKETYIRTLKNFDSEQPYQHVNYYVSVLLSEHSWTKTELLDATEQLNVEVLREFIKKLLSKMHVESFVHGNVNKAGSLELVSTVMDRLRDSVGL